MKKLRKQITEWIDWQAQSLLSWVAVPLVVGAALLFLSLGGCGVTRVWYIATAESPEGMAIHTKAELDAAGIVRVKTDNENQWRWLYNLSGIPVVPPVVFPHLESEANEICAITWAYLYGFPPDSVRVFGFIREGKQAMPLCYSTAPYTKIQAEKTCWESLNRELLENKPDIHEVVCGGRITEGKDV